MLGIYVLVSYHPPHRLSIAYHVRTVSRRVRCEGGRRGKLTWALCFVTQDSSCRFVALIMFAVPPNSRILYVCHTAMLLSSPNRYTHKAQGNVVHGTRCACCIGQPLLELQPQKGHSTPMMRLCSILQVSDHSMQSQSCVAVKSGQWTYLDSLVWVAMEFWTQP